jgi:hypothetical protein
MPTFLPNGYEPPATNSKYYRFEQGSNKFRILSPAIVGWEDWDNRQPVRTHEKPEENFDPKKPAKHFWAFIAWDYRKKSLTIVEITQVGIQRAISSLVDDEDWGDPKNYDINIVREGEGLDSEYTVQPVPPKKLHPEIARLYSESNINLEALFDGDDPWGEVTTKTAKRKAAAPAKKDKHGFPAEEEPAENTDNENIYEPAPQNDDDDIDVSNLPF